MPFNLGWARPRDASEHEAHDDSPTFESKEKFAEPSNIQLQTEDRGGLSEEAGDGVKAARATTIVWSRNALLSAYALIFLIFFVNSFQQQISNTLVPYVTSTFFQQGLTATTGVVSSLVSGIVKLPVAKLINVWGRPQGYVLMLVCAVVGLILMAACRNVETYAAGQVFYWVGFNGIDFVLDVFIADTSSLKNRALMFAFATSPYIATTFAGPAAAQSFLRTSGWPWGYGTFTIIVPAISVPFLTVFWYNQRLAKQQGVIAKKRASSGRTAWQSTKHHFIEFDVIGIVLLCAGWSLLLLPFSIAVYQPAGWASGMIIAMLVVGFVCLVAFGLHERFTARNPFLPFHLLVDRTVLSACFLSGIRFSSFYCWDSYFSSFLQVVYYLSPSNAGYVANIYNIGTCFFAIIVGILVRWSGRIKWIAICGLPLQTLGTGLMIHFRQPDQPLGYTIMCQILIAFGGGALVITEQMAIMAAVGPENVAPGLALQAVFTAIGYAIGATISGAIWVNTFPAALSNFLPDVSSTDRAGIFASLDTQLGYAPGSATRDGIIEAYAYSQRLMCIAGTALLSLAYVCVFLWRDYRVKDFKQPQGNTVV